MDFSFMHSQGRSSVQTASVVWWISFGDLLTLLLCFFLVLTPWDKLRASNQSKAKQELSKEPSPSGGFGTAFAKQQRGSQVEVLAEIPLYRDQFSGEYQIEELSLFGSLATETEHIRSKVGSVALKLCDRGVDRLRIAAQVGALLASTREHASKVRIEFASSCESLEVLRPVTDSVVGVISIRGA
jgi:flagellar motor protein MotB